MGNHIICVSSESPLGYLLEFPGETLKTPNVQGYLREATSELPGEKSRSGHLEVFQLISFALDCYLRRNCVIPVRFWRSLAAAAGFLPLPYQRDLLAERCYFFRKGVKNTSEAWNGLCPRANHDSNHIIISRHCSVLGDAIGVLEKIALTRWPGEVFLLDWLFGSR